MSRPAEEHRTPCMSQRAVAGDVQEHKRHFKSGQKLRKKIISVDLSIKHLSVTKPLLSSMTQLAVYSGKALFRSFSHIREELPQHSAGVVLIPKPFHQV